MSSPAPTQKVGRLPDSDDKNLTTGQHDLQDTNSPIGRDTPDENTDEKLRTAEFRSFESFEEAGNHQQVQLQIANREAMLLQNLQKDVAE